MVIATAISVYPNPFDHFVTVEVTCEENQDCILLLADLQQSKIIRMLGAGLTEGTNKILLDGLGSLQTGSYQLDIRTAAGDILYQTLLIKQTVLP
jgi:hypothetical protein